MRIDVLVRLLPGRARLVADVAALLALTGLAAALFRYGAEVLT